MVGRRYSKRIAFVIPGITDDINLKYQYMCINMHISITIWDGKWCWQGRCMSAAAAADCRDMDTPGRAALPTDRQQTLNDLAHLPRDTMRMWITIGIP